MLAVEAPVKKLIAVGGVALALAAGLALRPHRAHAHADHQYRLSLHAASEPGAVYYTMFANGDVIVDRLPDRGQAAHVNWNVQTPDGCYWHVTETFVRTDEHSLAYSYNEEPRGCDPDAVPSYIATPRTGDVGIDSL